MRSLQSHSSEETVRFGRTFASTLKVGDVVALLGELGTGKTHFVSGVCQGLGVHDHVASPTFTIINEYPAPACTVVHVDLYRIASHSELAGLGIEEYFVDRNICLIEWAERMADYLPHSYIRVRFSYGQGDEARLIQIDEVGQRIARSGGVEA